MLVSTANIMGNPLMSQKKVVLDVKTVKSRSTVVGWQEISNARYKKAVREVYGADWETCQLGVSIPISVRASAFKILKSGHQLAHHGKALASPNRYIAWAYLADRNDALCKFVLMNTHYVSGAWNNKPKPHKKWRQRMWHVHYAQQKQLVLDAHRAGFTVVGTGDFNRVDVKKFHPDQHWLENGGIDKLWYLEGAHGPKIKVVSAALSTNLCSDHHLKTSRLQLH